MAIITAAVMTNGRADSRVPHVLRRLARFSPAVTNDHGSPWKTGKAAWSAIGPGATHHLVAQDDIRIHAGIYDAIEALVDSFPNMGFAFYVQWNTINAYRVRMAALGGMKLVQASAREWVPTQLLLLPRRFCEAIASLPDNLGRMDDEVLARLFYHMDPGCDIGITVPNLVEHDDDPALGTSSHHGLRRTACFAGENDVWIPPAQHGWEGDGWEEISVILRPSGTHLSFAITGMKKQRSTWRVEVPWRIAMPCLGLNSTDVADAGERALAMNDWYRRALVNNFLEAVLFEYAISCVLYGIAWRNWWRGGRSPLDLRFENSSYSAFISLWRSFADISVPAEVLIEIGRKALYFGVEFDCVAAQDDVHIALEEWYSAVRWKLSRPLQNPQNRWVRKYSAELFSS